MEIRPADSGDCERVRTLTEESFRASYSLSPQQIATIVDNEFDAETLTGRFDDPASTVLVAVHSTGNGKGVQGFVDVATDGERTIRWLHVDPQARGEGTATALLDAVHELDDAEPLAARILEDAVEGGEFLEGFGLESDGTAAVSVGDEEFDVVVFAEGHGTEAENEPSVPVPESVSNDGTDYPLDRDEPIPGRDAPFFPTYSDDSETEPYGYFCSNCASTDVSGDGLDRLECGECGNCHRADSWDDSYL